ncbi:MAG: hypothetical protein PVJ19_22485 [Desulfobacteraceae bacterium]
MKSPDCDLGRRRFISVSSMVVGAGMLTGPRLLFASEPGSPGQGGPPQGGGGPMMGAPAKDDGTKYGKYIVLAQKNEATERGIPVVATMGGSIPDCDSMCLSGRMPPPGPMPGHDTWEKHAVPEYLIHLGSDPDDPMDLGADVELYLGKGKLREKYEFSKTTAVYLPAGLPHCPWYVRNIKKPMTFVNIMVGMPSWGPNDQSDEVLTKADLAKAKTSGDLFGKYLLSGVGKDVKHPEGGQMLAYTDCTRIASAPITRIIRYRPEKAPYSILGAQSREYASFLMFLGIDNDDASKLGAGIELRMGTEREVHTFDKSALVYVPPGVPHELSAKSAEKPFNFVEVVLGPEFPGTI